MDLLDPIKTEVDVKRSEKKDFVSNLKEDFSNATSVIVAEYSGLTVNETEQLRKEMRDNGAKFKVTKNRLTKLAISETQFKDISELFKGPTAIAYSDDAVAPAKVAVSFEKKFEKSSLRLLTKSFFSERFTSTSVSIGSKRSNVS